QAGYNPVVAVGFAYAGAVDKVAAQFPDTKFAIVDSAKGPKTPANVTSLLFAENEGSFLVGAIAALKSKTGNIGFVGGVQVPLIKKFEAGYYQGAKYAKPDIQVKAVYAGVTDTPFRDPHKGKEPASALDEDGAD